MSSVQYWLRQFFFVGGGVTLGRFGFIKTESDGAINLKNANATA